MLSIKTLLVNGKEKDCSDPELFELPELLLPLLTVKLTFPEPPPPHAERAEAANARRNGFSVFLGFLKLCFKKDKGNFICFNFFIDKTFCERTSL